MAYAAGLCSGGLCSVVSGSTQSLVYLWSLPGLLGSRSVVASPQSKKDSCYARDL